MLRSSLVLLFALAALLAIAMAIVLVQYYAQGPGWDLIAHYENGRSLLKPLLYQCLASPPCGLQGGQPTFWYGTYFEPYRAPVSGAIFALVYLVAGSSTMIAYIALLMALYMVAVWVLSRGFGSSPSVMYALLLSPAIVFTSIIGGSEEIISLILLFLGLHFLAKRNPLFGLFLGLATLGKYPTLALVPMLLLLYRPKRILAGAVLFVAAVTPWLVFSQIYLHGALASYSMSLAIEGFNRQAYWLSPVAYATLVGYPAVFIAMAAVAARRKLEHIIGSVSRALRWAGLLRRVYNDDVLYRFAISAVFLALALGATLYIGPYWDTFTQIRYGYLLAASAGLFAAMVLGIARRYSSIDLRVLAVATAIVILVVFLAFYIREVSSASQLNADSAVLSNAATELGRLGYAGCRVVTNDWVYMLWHNVSAFSQFYYNSTSERYPILVFHNWSAATEAGAVRGASNAIMVYSSANFSILLPKGYECIG